MVLKLDIREESAVRLFSESADGRIVVAIPEVVKNVGSRSAGREVRNLVENLVEADGRKVVIDFCDMENCSSGFVDELLGRLLEKYGFVAFSQFVSFIHVQGIVALLINRSIAQRMVEMQRKAANSCL